MNRSETAKEIIERNKRFIEHLDSGKDLADIPKEDLVQEWEVIEYADEIEEILK